MSSEGDVSSEVQQMIEETQAMMTEGLFEETLRTQAHVDPIDLSALLDVLALGITNSCWRNSCVETWHAEGRLSDGDMMRINSHTTHGIRQRLTGWTTEFGITSGSSAALAEVTVEDVDLLAHRIFRWLTNPKRKLPTGITLSELAQSKEELEEYEDHADRRLGGFSGQMEEKGVRFGLLYMACHGALACSKWWLHPSWPDRVQRFITVLDNPTDRHWGPDGDWLKRLEAEPPAVRDRGALHAMLLQAPWNLGIEAAEWITDAGIGYLAPTKDPNPAQ
ncbi:MULTISPECIES: hypothetical protein [unclassified Streptomyces]|uniref:hypothetical protein n=1 Tax=unclassified Streptomyces TaxID=2593676 RepID=UPI00036A6952|nr:MULTISPECIES: hypothetical protein [unclassified Streptomyces]MYT28116.1 hypothetical protein [Streptomyces sp. SID8354]